MDQTVCVFPKNKFQEVRVGIREFKGNDLVDIRIWTIAQGVDQMVPTAKGVTINIHLLPQLLKALQDTEKILKENVLTPNNKKLIEISHAPNGGFVFHISGDPPYFVTIQSFDLIISKAFSPFLASSQL